MSSIIALTAAAIAMPAAAQVYKCVDKTGHTTYQEAPCGGGTQGSTVDLKEPLSVRPAGNEAMWSAAAREQRALVGMPKTFVTAALGTPAEIRAPRSGETGSEVWVYAKRGQPMRIGFANNAVAWMRDDAAPDQRTVLPASGASAASGNASREARVRDALVVGKTCTAALQDAGRADREEPLTAGASTGARYVFVFDEGNANAFAAFVCLNGRVTSVERYVPGR